MTDHPTPPNYPDPPGPLDPPDRRVCGDRAHLPTRLVLLALRLAPSREGQREDVQRELRCVMEEAHAGAHHGFAMELDGVDTGSVWTRWLAGEEPGDVVVLADCNAARADGMDACGEFAGHPGAHSWELDDPWRATRA
ncbi:hypothetical protein ACFO3J_02150 [Streptomyces polygonati]|uniref:Uncharacterized protein n=1 Tax=Streptomyces polygonati TaxID=1617087 RepID=A0ABV8HGR4_9ACTN